MIWIVSQLGMHQKYWICHMFIELLPWNLVSVHILLHQKFSKPAKPHDIRWTRWTFSSNFPNPLVKRRNISTVSIYLLHSLGVFIHLKYLCSIRSISSVCNVIMICFMLILWYFMVIYSIAIRSTKTKWRFLFVGMNRDMNIFKFFEPWLLTSKEFIYLEFKAYFVQVYHSCVHMLTNITVRCVHSYVIH